MKLDPLEIIEHQIESDQNNVYEVVIFLKLEYARIPLVNIDQRLKIRT